MRRQLESSLAEAIHRIGGVNHDLASHVRSGVGGSSGEGSGTNIMHSECRHADICKCGTTIDVSIRKAHSDTQKLEGAVQKLQHHVAAVVQHTLPTRCLCVCSELTSLSVWSVPSDAADVSTRRQSCKDWCRGRGRQLGYSILPSGSARWPWQATCRVRGRSSRASYSPCCCHRARRANAPCIPGQAAAAARASTEERWRHRLRSCHCIGHCSRAGSRCTGGR